MIARIDERDPQLVFTPNEAWFTGGSVFDYMKTTMGTRTGGARLGFNFTGTGVEVFGTISHNLSSSTVSNIFTVDGGASVQWSQKPQLLPSYNVSMFSVQGLEGGVHKLIMEILVEDSETWVDYLVVNASTESSFNLPPNTRTPFTPGSNTSDSSRTMTSSASLPPGPPTSSTQRSGSVLSPGAVAGTAVGAISGLFLVSLLAGWSLRRRWRRSKNRSRETAFLFLITGSLARWSMNTRSAAHIRPFLLLASTVEESRKNAEQPSSSGAVLQPVRDSGRDHQPNTPRLDDPPPSMVTRIDERDPRLVFTPNGAWFPAGKKPEYMETTMGTTTAGARMSFNFTGTGIEVFGTLSNDIRAPAVLNVFTIDGGTSVQWSQHPVLGHPTQYNAKMFSTRELEDGTHNLVMEVMVKDSATYIDYLEVNTSVGSSISLPPGVPTSLSQQITSSTISLSAPTSLPAPTSITAPTVTPGTDAGGGLSRGAVAAISISGTLAFVLGLLLLLWCLRKRGGGKMKDSRGTHMFRE
ncbi:hypothetical protein PQX77_006218 [Marasmius sp. AFHP31]|nr:hypothetical protein PQX77_006218 [Marasmius sp. AFHP31]